MKRIALVLALAASGLLIGAGAPPPANCATCIYTGICLNSSICGDCVCLKEALSPTGRCVSISRR